ncbi:ABC transporter permease [Streptomyces tagetis]|uniref:ABC transporter permease n=1 Tax=Streptomyces tagetis TaxID=2820809 RepID=A0A940XIB5_9ACTN|nr:ABC transporter permease [Streptomyces sp. RG38]MBQ0825080.1 ABC transporter permease [Streptomyces sp. RG38]
MTTTETRTRSRTPHIAHKEAVAGQREGRATFPDSLHAEYIKIRTMRSTLYVVLGTIAVGAAIATLVGSSAGDGFATMTTAEKATFDPLALSLRGYMLAQVTIALLGGMSITAEYGSRTVVSTLTAVPHRSRVLAAKAVVLAAVAFLTGLLFTFASFLAGQAALKSGGTPSLTLSDPSAWRAIVGGALFLTLAGLLGLATGTLIRSTTATVTTLFAAFLIVPAFGPAFPGALSDWTSRYWPSSAGGQIMTGYQDPALLHPWPGLAVMTGCVALVLTAAFLTFRKRDA